MKNSENSLDYGKNKTSFRIFVLSSLVSLLQLLQLPNVNNFIYSICKKKIFFFAEYKTKCLVSVMPPDVSAHVCSTILL